MKLNDESDVLKAVAEELNIPLVKVNSVVNEFWKSVKHLLSNPHLIKAGVRMTGFGRIMMRLQRMETFVNKAVFQSGRNPGKPVQYIKDVLTNYYKKYESKQKNSPEDNVQKRARVESYFGRESCYVETDQGTFDLFHFKLSKTWKYPRPRRIRK